MHKGVVSLWNSWYVTLIVTPKKIREKKNIFQFPYIHTNIYMFFERRTRVVGFFFFEKMKRKKSLASRERATTLIEIPNSPPLPHFFLLSIPPLLSSQGSSFIVSAFSPLPSLKLRFYPFRLC